MLPDVLCSARLYGSGAVRAAVQLASERRQDYHALLALLAAAAPATTTTPPQHAQFNSKGTSATPSSNTSSSDSPTKARPAAGGGGAANGSDSGIHTHQHHAASSSDVLQGVSEEALEVLATTPLMDALMLDVTPEYEAAWRAVAAVTRHALPRLHALACRCVAHGLGKQNR